MMTSISLRKLTDQELIDCALNNTYVDVNLVKFELVRRLENLHIEYSNLLKLANTCSNTVKASIDNHHSYE